MDSIIKEIKEYREENSLTIEECAKKLQLSTEQLENIENEQLELDDQEVQRIRKIIENKSKSTGRRIRKILDLLFRFGATIMALVVLLLCINGYAETNTLIALLSIGVVCSSLTILPKIEK